MAILFRHDDELRETARQLSRRAEEKEIAAGVWAAGETLVARATDNRRVDGDPVPGLQAGDGPTDFLRDAGTFMPDYERILDNLIADSSLGIITDVRAAHSDRTDPDQDIGLFLKKRIRDIADFYSASPG
jgi:hypothetical protein